MRKSLILPLGMLTALVFAVAVNGCGSNGGGLDNGGSTGSGGSGGSANGSGGSSNGQGGFTAGQGGNANGQGGDSNGQGGSANGQGGNGQGGAQMAMGGRGQGGNIGRGGAMAQGGNMGQGGAINVMCQPSAMCMAGGMCMGPCQTAQGRLGTRDCACVNGMLFCGQCQAAVTNPNACPDMPQGKACTNATPTCQYQSGGGGSCLCVSDKWACPNLPAPMGSAMCPDRPAFMACDPAGAYCARSQNTSCVCANVGNVNRWLCQ